jgi:O-antigen biosynthesis rhamnosyltransferase
VVDGRTGLVVPPSDAPALARAIQYLCEHPAEASAMGRLGRDRIDQDFNIRETIRRTLAVYEDALADPELN